MSELTLKLLTPIVSDSLTVESLNLRELKVKELLALEKSALANNRTSGEQEIHRFALMTGLSPDAISEIGERDWNRLRSKYWETLGNVVEDGLEDPPSE